MHGDYYLNKRFSDEYLNELATLLVCLFLAVVIALIAGWAAGETKFTIHNSALADKSKFSIQNLEDGAQGTESIAAEPQPSSFFTPGETIAVAVLMSMAFGSTAVLVAMHKLSKEEFRIENEE